MGFHFIEYDGELISNFLTPSPMPPSPCLEHILYPESRLVGITPKTNGKVIVSSMNLREDLFFFSVLRSLGDAAGEILTRQYDKIINLLCAHCVTVLIFGAGET